MRDILSRPHKYLRRRFTTAASGVLRWIADENLGGVLNAEYPIIMIDINDKCNLQCFTRDGTPQNGSLWELVIMLPYEDKDFHPLHSQSHEPVEDELLVMDFDPFELGDTMEDMI